MHLLALLCVLMMACILPAPGEITEPDKGNTEETVGEPLTLGDDASYAKPNRTDEHSCGNGQCTGSESCGSCPSDCGACDSGSVCGDTSCGADEDCSSCTSDCGSCPPEPSVCGNAVCDADENCSDCASDCGSCPSACGDDSCDGNEDCATCAADCGACPSVCGDNSCGADEDCGNCAADCGACPPLCGDAVCDAGEDCGGCAADCGSCGAVCGNDACQASEGESCVACAADCDTSAAVCGNGECQLGEDSANCEADCGLATWSGSSFEEEVVVLINQHRAAGTDCSEGAKSPVGPLTMNEQLRMAARLHSWDQSYSGYFSHTSCNGRSPWQRAADAGTSASGETVGLGYATPAAVVTGWMNSNGHCDILMGSGSTEVGIGFATPGSNLWTGMFR